MGIEEQEEGNVVTIERVKVPRLYKVLLHNDDYTTMEFVINLLMRHFGKNREEARQIMLEVHERGIGLCGIYTREIAETKVNKVIQDSKQQGHPLMCTYEPE